LGCDILTNVMKIKNKIRIPALGGQKGFTLVELLVVIAIVAALSVVVILYINPAEMMKQARDSTRMSDFATIQKAISMLASDQNGLPIGDPAWCYVSTSQTVPSAGCGIFQAGITVTSTGAGDRSVNGAGWIPLNFASISSGDPLGTLPADPVNTTDYFYAYVANASGQYELALNQFESTRYRRGGDQGRPEQSSYAGSNPQAYVVGTVPSLDM